MLVMKVLRREVCIYAWDTVGTPEGFAGGSVYECICIPPYKVLSDGACDGDRRIEVHVRTNRCVWTEASEPQAGTCHVVGVPGRRLCVLRKTEGGKGETLERSMRRKGTDTSRMSPKCQALVL